MKEKHRLAVICLIMTLIVIGCNSITEKATPTAVKIKPTSTRIKLTKPRPTSTRISYEGMSIKGTVSRRRYLAPTVSSSESEYYVEITLTNKNPEPVIVNQIRSAFVAKTWCLKTETFNLANEGLIEPYASKIWGLATNGYTRDLLVNAGERPLKLIFFFCKEKTIVAGPYLVELPDIKDLSSRCTLDFRELNPFALGAMGIWKDLKVGKTGVEIE